MKTVEVIGGPRRVAKLAGGSGIVSVVTPPPLVLAVTPSTGSRAGGDSVTISGLFFTGATAVTFDGVGATSVVVAADDTITCVTPAHSPSSVAVKVTTAHGTGTLTGGFTYLPATPTVTSVDPAVGDTAGGGFPVTITGVDFTGTTGVTFGGVAATSVSVVSDTQITCIPPAHATGLVNVAVTNAIGTGTGTNAFRYWTPAEMTGVLAYLDSNKGVTASVGLVSAWVSQSSGSAEFDQSADANKPEQISGQFGLLPSLRFSGAQWLDGTAALLLDTGLSLFFVGKTTFSYPLPTGFVAGTVVGRNDISVWTAFGYDGAVNGSGLRFGAYDAAGAFQRTFFRSSGINDGTTRLYGVTSDTTPNRQMYIDGAATGAVDSPDGGYSTTNMKLLTIGRSYLDTDYLTADIGAIVIVNGVSGSTDLSRLHSWSRQRYGTA